MPTNTGYISTLAQNPANHLIDTTDAVHSGIVKSLNLMSKGTYIAWGFNITMSAGATVTSYTCSNGGYFRDGVYSTYTSEGAIHNANILMNPNNDWYAMIVLDSNGGVKIRGTNALGATSIKGADPNAGDIPIAMVRIELNSPDKSITREVQYLTAKTITQGDSIGYANGGSTEYIEAMSITADSTKTLFQSKVADADVIFKLADTTTDEIFKVVDSADQVQFSINGAGAASIDQTLTLGSTLTSDGVIISGSDGITSNASMIFRIDADESVTPHTAIYSFRAGSTPTEVVKIEEDGQTTISGNLITNGVIQGSGGAGANGSLFNQATYSGILNLGNFAGTVYIGASNSQCHVGDIQVNGNEIRNATTSASISFTGATSTNIENSLVTKGGIVNQKAYNAQHSFAADNNAGQIGTSSFMRGTMAAALATPIDINSCEIVYIGFNKQTHTFVAAGGGNPETTTVTYANAGAAGANPELVVMLTDEETKASVNTFGGMQGFIALPPPDNFTGRRITLRNNCQYACYVVVQSPIDPAAADDNIFDGGITSVSQHGTGIYHSNSVVDITRVHTHNVAPPVYGSLPSNGKSKNAILIKPNCAVDLIAIQLVGDTPAPLEISAEQGNSASSQWYVIGQSGTQIAQPVNTTLGADTAEMYLPVAYSGTMFMNSVNKSWFLPDHPPIGTTYTICCTANTATVISSNDGTHQIVSVWGNADGTKDSMYLLDAAAITSTTVTATNAKTFIYTEDRKWMVIG